MTNIINVTRSNNVHSSQNVTRSKDIVDSKNINNVTNCTNCINVTNASNLINAMNIPSRYFARNRSGLVNNTREISVWLPQWFLREIWYNKQDNISTLVSSESTNYAINITSNFTINNVFPEIVPQEADDVSKFYDVWGNITHFLWAKPRVRYTIAELNNTDIVAINKSLNGSVFERSSIKLILPDNLTRITVINDVRIVLEINPRPHVIFFFHANINTSNIEQIYRCVYN